MENVEMKYVRNESQFPYLEKGLTNSLVVISKVHLPSILTLVTLFPNFWQTKPII